MRVPFTSTQRLALRGVLAVSVLVIVHALILALALSQTGCQNRMSRGIVSEQKPGLATGAGATFTGPANSAAASTQVAQRRVAYYAPPAASAPVAAPLPVRTESPAAPQAAPAPAAHAPSYAPPPGPPAPAWIDERTETSFGQHQDAAGLMKAATAIGSWGRARWFGILCLLASIGGLLYAHGNPEGYPLICWKVGAVGVFLAVFDPSPWWLLLLILPAGFYVVQKLNLLRLP
jgi:hypothetical protein